MLKVEIFPTGNAEVGDAMGDMYEANLLFTCDCGQTIMSPPVWLPAQG